MNEMHQKRVLRHTVRALSVAAAGVTLVVCTACTPVSAGPASPQPEISVPTTNDSMSASQQAVTNAVQQAVPGASNIVVTVSQSGASRGWAVEVDTTEPSISADVLRETLLSIVDADPGAGHIDLVYYSAGTDTVVSVTTAAESLGVPYSPYGGSGTWQTAQLAVLSR